jgi:pimeloyl-ACP methyl ester carboxylesterase
MDRSSHLGAATRREQRARGRRLCLGVEMTDTWEQWRAEAISIDVDGLDVAIYDRGDPEAPALTFLHGFPSSSLDIAPVWRELGDGWRLLAVDFPGFGASDKPSDRRYSIHGATDAVEGLWRERSVTSTLVVAHDYGVSVGQELLARHSEGTLAVELTGVVWMNGGLYPDLHRPTVGQQLLIDDGGAELAASVDEELFLGGIEVTWGFRVPMDRELVGEIFASMHEGDGVARMHDLLGYVADRRQHEQRWRTALEGTDLPMTFVWGDLDPVSGAHMIERVEQRVPDAAVVRMHDVGHWPLLEAPDVVASAVAEFNAG